MDVRLCGIQFRGALQFGDGVTQLVLEFECEAEIVVQRGVFWGNLQCRLKLSNGCIEIGFLQIGCSQVAAVSRVIRAEPQSRFELWDGTRSVANLDQRQSKIVVSVRIVRLKLNRTPIRSDRPIGVSGTLQQ